MRAHTYNQEQLSGSHQNRLSLEPNVIFAKTCLAGMLLIYRSAHLIIDQTVSSKLSVREDFESASVNCPCAMKIEPKSFSTNRDKAYSRSVPGITQNLEGADP